MIYATDESGSFALQRASFECSLLTTLVCPPSLRRALAAFVDARCVSWEVPELHAAELDSDQRREVAIFLANQDLIWTATVIDNEIFPGAEVKPWREKQSSIFEDSWQASQERGSTHPTYVGRGDEVRRLLRRGASSASFVEYAIVMPRHVHDAVQASIARYRGRHWRRDWGSSHLFFDAKDRYGERLLTNILFPILATDAMALDLPVDYQEAGHPLRTTHRSSSSGIDLVSFFGATPSFPESHAEPLIQLADVIGWIAQRHLRFPDDDDARDAFRILRRRQFSTDIWRFRFFARRDIGKADLRRYAHLL